MLYNDLDERPGGKFAATDLIGIPWQVMVGPRSLAEGKVQLKRCADGSRELVTPAGAVERLTGLIRGHTSARTEPWHLRPGEHTGKFEAD